MRTERVGRRASSGMDLPPHILAVGRHMIVAVSEDHVVAGAAPDRVDLTADDVDAVVTGATGDHVGREVAEDRVVAGAAGDAVGAAVAGDLVVAVLAEDAVIAGAAGDRVVASAAVALVVAPLAVDVVVAPAAKE